MTAKTEILWRSDALMSTERCVIKDLPGKACIKGTATIVLRDAPVSIEYEIDTKADWSVAAAHIVLTGAASSQVIDLGRSESGWRVDGELRPDLHRCTNVDLGWSPATNTLPLRAVPLQAGESATSYAAWVRFPELDVVASEQTYRRLAADRVQYSSATFDAELAMAEGDVVKVYGDSLWRADTVRRVV